jgi:hypothetical protein
VAESGSTASRTPRSAGGRLRFAWRALSPERKLAAVAAAGLFATLFLPWYQETVIPTGFGAKTALPSASLTGWAAFSFVEAAVLLVSLAVLTLLFTRAEGRAFHVPGGDGGVITGAGFWTGVLILWRMFDKSGTDGHGQFVTTSGIEWGIFIALGVSGLLAYAGQRIRLLHTPEPPLPGERRAPRPARRGRRARTSRPEPPGAADSEPDAGWVTPESHGPPTPRRAPEPRPQPSPSAGAPGRRDDLPRGVSRSDAQAIESDDPPEAPTVRRLAGPDEQLTIPLENPE